MQILGGWAVRRSVRALARDAGMEPVRLERDEAGLTVHVRLGPGPQDPVGLFRAVGARHPGLRLRVVTETTKPRR